MIIIINKQLSDEFKLYNIIKLCLLIFKQWTRIQDTTATVLRRLRPSSTDLLKINSF